MFNRFLVPMLSFAFLISAVSAVAHHSFAAEYDESKPLTLEGVVTRVDWENPHVHFYVDVTGADGTVVNWVCETGGPTRLTRRGWTHDSLKPGDRVIVHGFPAKDSSHAVDGRQVTMADGRKIGSGPSH
jgi:hypothetical protein